MKKIKFLTFIIICLGIFASSLCFLPNNVVEAEADSSYQQITSLSEITDADGRYILKNDVVFNQNMLVDFTGVLDGAGYNITYDNTKGYTSSLFNSLGSGAVIKNINFISNDIIKFYQSGLGYIADTITDATIENISFTNCALYTEYETANKGFIAGVIKNSKIANIKIINSVINGDCLIDPQNPDSNKIGYNTNIGFIAGKACDGTVIKNCYISNSSIDLEIVDCEAESFNFGGIAGCVENSTISNNILDFYVLNEEQVKETINFTSKVEKSINFGGIAGLMDYDKNFAYNNIVAIDENSITLSEPLGNSNIGAMVGNLQYEPSKSNIEGFVTTYQDKLFGKAQSAEVDYDKIIITNYEQLNSSIFQDATLWDDREAYKWDFGLSWVLKAGAKFPTLQCFENYAVSFDAEESLKSLNLEVMPTIENNDYSLVVASYLSANTLPTDSSASSLDAVEYGSDIYIKVKISEEKNYNKFFYIAGLQLNGKTIYDNQNGVMSSDVNVEVESFDDATSEYIYKINNFNANCEGVYNVLLGRQTYKIKVKVYDLGTHETGSLIPGKFKTNSETNPIEEKVLNMQYGERFVLSSYVTNLDYSDKVSWFIYNNSQEDVFGEPIVFTPNEDNANYYANKIDFTFNETSSIFKGETDDEKTYFSFSEYAEVENENQEIQSNYELILVYNKRVKQVKIVFRLENGDEVNQKLANLLIDDKSDRLTWNQEEGVYYAKVAFDRGNISEYIIDIETISTEYEFLSWSFDIGKLAGVEGDDIAGIFEISEDTEEPLTIYCDVKLSKENVGGNLIWLWITLGAVALVAIIVIIIIVVKKRRGGGSSYKKYYY